MKYLLVGKGSVLHSQGLRTSYTLQMFIKYQQPLSARKIQAHYAGGRDPETSTTARELWLLCKLNQIDPMGIDLLGFSCSDMGENSGIIMSKCLQRANHCCSACYLMWLCTLIACTKTSLISLEISVIMPVIFSSSHLACNYNNRLVVTCFNTSSKQSSTKQLVPNSPQHFYIPCPKNTEQLTDLNPSKYE